MNSAATKTCPTCRITFPPVVSVCPDDGSMLVYKLHDDETLVGRTVDGRYKVEKLLAEGGMGRVYIARQLSVDRRVALKVLRRSIASDAQSVQRFQNEARAASQLTSSHTVTVFDFGQEPSGLLYLAMEFVEGCSLYRVVEQDGPLPTARAIPLACHVLESLGEAHDKGIVHRDVKPDNVLVTTTPTGEEWAKVTDFGIAKVTSDGKSSNLTTTGVVVGTPRYVSPEQIRGLVLDARSDLYSLAVVVYELLAGAPPFVDEAAVALLVRHLNDEPRPLHEVNPSVSLELSRVVHRALAKDRDERPQTARELREQLIAAGERAAQRVTWTRPQSPRAVVAETVAAPSPPPGAMRSVPDDEPTRVVLRAAPGPSQPAPQSAAQPDTAVGQGERGARTAFFDVSDEVAPRPGRRPAADAAPARPAPAAAVDAPQGKAVGEAPQGKAVGEAPGRSIGAAGKAGDAPAGKAVAALPAKAVAAPPVKASGAPPAKAGGAPPAASAGDDGVSGFEETAIGVLAARPGPREAPTPVATVPVGAVHPAPSEAPGAAAMARRAAAANAETARHPEPIGAHAPQSGRQRRSYGLLIAIFVGVAVVLALAAAILSKRNLTGASPAQPASAPTEATTAPERIDPEKPTVGTKRPKQAAKNPAGKAGAPNPTGAATSAEALPAPANDKAGATNELAGAAPSEALQAPANDKVGATDEIAGAAPSREPVGDAAEKKGPKDGQEAPVVLQDETKQASQATTDSGAGAPATVAGAEPAEVPGAPATAPAADDPTAPDPISPPAAPAQHHVRVLSEPPGALVLQGGESVGETPFDAVVEGAPLNLVLRRSGFRDAKATVDADSPSEVRVTLKPRAPRGPKNNTGAETKKPEPKGKPAYTVPYIE